LAKPVHNTMQKIRDQRVVVDELTAQLTLCVSADYARIKSKLDEATIELTALEAHWSKPPRKGPPHKIASRPAQKGTRRPGKPTARPKTKKRAAKR
jgi:hypothetical protein